ncbi:MAG: OmpL47-type beta-barrel domain-containing protein, partial [Candidatus Heimdallarchaeota archaeon]
LFTFETNVSVSFNVTFNIIFKREQAYSVISEYFVNSEQNLVDWNCTFTSSSITLENYDISNRTFIFTCPTDWGIYQVYNNSAPYIADHYGVSGFGSFWINANTSIVGSTWQIDANSPNYVVEVWVINAETLQNLTEAQLGQQISVNTQLNSGYTSTFNTLNITLLDSASAKVNSTWFLPTSNPYNVKYTLNTIWSSGVYTIKSFYYNGTEVGLETTTLTVFTPTYLSQETEFTTSTVIIGEPVYFAVYYNDSLRNQAVTDATVIMSPDWASSLTGSYNSTHGFYQTSIETSKALEGTHTIMVNASRQFYHSQNNIQFNIQLVNPPPMDVTPPTTTIKFSGTFGLDGWFISDVTVRLSATDDLSGIINTAYSIDGINWNIYTGLFPIATEGRSTIFYNSTDRAGNMEPTKTATIKIDKTPPETKISLDCTLGLEGWYVSDDVIVTLTATDAHSKVAQTVYSIDHVNWNIYTESFIFTTEGINTISYYSTDVSGNVEAIKTEIIKIDKTKPITDLSIEPLYIEKDGTLYVTNITEFTLIPTDSGSGVAHTSYRINGNEWINYNGPFTLVGPDGTYNLDYNSTDTAGNIELTNTIKVILDTAPSKDTTPPITTLNIGEPKYVTDITYITPKTPFTLEIEDDADLSDYSTVYRIYPGTDDTGTGWILYTAPFHLTSLTDGTYTIEFYSKDHVGNMETPQSIQVTLFSWNYVFTDSYGRGTILKINTEYEFFQFITPHKDYRIRKATIMRERVYYQIVIKRHNRNIRIKRIIHHTIYIKYKDNELCLTALVNPKRDFCVVIAWEIQVKKPYILKDKPGIL